jgi:CHAT domain-containing protein
MTKLDNVVEVMRSADNPLELLVLSGVQSTAGDQRAALGLASVAIKTGSKSVLTSLWTGSEKATSLLMFDFYRNLVNENVSKAIALQRAQIVLINSSRYRHPAYWASFLMIGDWS